MYCWRTYTDDSFSYTQSIITRMHLNCARNYCYRLYVQGPKYVWSEMVTLYKHKYNDTHTDDMQHATDLTTHSTVYTGQVCLNMAMHSVDTH